MSNGELKQLTYKSASEMTHTFKEHGNGNMGKGVMRIFEGGFNQGYNKGYNKGFTDGKIHGVKEGLTQGHIEGVIITLGLVGLLISVLALTNCRNSKKENEFA